MENPNLAELLRIIQEESPRSIAVWVIDRPLLYHAVVGYLSQHRIPFRTNGALFPIGALPIYSYEHRHRESWRKYLGLYYLEAEMPGIWVQREGGEDVRIGEAEPERWYQVKGFSQMRDGRMFCMLNCPVCESRIVARMEGS